MVEVFPAEARKSRDEFSSRKEVHGYGWLRRVYTRGGVSPSGHEWSLQDFYIEGGGGEEICFDATSLHGDSRGREGRREVRAKVRNLGMEYLEEPSIEVS